MSTKGTSEDSSEVHQNDGNDGKSFEEAISATGFGLYNILLVATSLIWFSASLNITTSPGLIMPIAQCDLDLDLDRKGWLNSIVYLGMIFGASIWGVVGDMFGRKIIITGGLFLLGTFNILFGFTTSYYMLVILEFFAGFVASGPIGAYMVYVPEFLGVKYRARVMVFVCSFITLGAIVSMLFGLLILTQSINISIGSREYHSWQVYYWACSSFGLIGGCLSLLFPESPKYLMSRGKNAEALKALQRIYSINTRKSSESYPIKSLRDESQSNGQSHQSVESGEKSEKDAKAPSHIFRKAFEQFIPIFQRPYLFNCLLAGFIEFFQLLGVNTMRSWMPQVFALLTTNTSPDEGVCEHIFQPPPDATTTPENQICEVLSDKSIYVNSIIVQGVGVLGVFVAVYLVTIVGNKTILIVTTTVAGIASLAIYFAANSMTIVILYSLAVGIVFSGQASYNSILANLAPTSIRFTLISVSITLGRLGSTVGNLIFPNLMKVGCWPPFVAMSLSYLLSAFMCFFLPKTTRQPLQ